MASLAQTLPPQTGSRWLWEWLNDELAPYPGRAFLVARMVTSATLVMIISMTFGLPYAPYAALFALNVSRESLEETRRAVLMIVVGFLLAGAYLVVGAMLVLGDPLLRFVWIVTSLFLIFYGISATRNFAAWTRFGYMVVITVPLWDRQITAQAKVDEVLWAVGMLTMATVISLLLEIGYAVFRRGDDVMDPITERLAYVEELLRSYADGRSVSMTTHANLTRLAMFGTSRLRALLARSNRGAQYVQEMGAFVALAGRLVDLAANLPRLSGAVSDADREQIAKVANRIAAIRHDLTKGLVRRTPQNSEAAESPPNLALFGEIERTVSLIADVFSSSELVTTFGQTAQAAGSRSSELAIGRLVDAEHLKFGLRGCVAASLCYMIYSTLSWPGISTSVTTCYLTALTTIGASRQKQVLRIGGAVIGGLLIGMGAQVLILPHIDSISGFTVLFIAVTSAAAWVATSSPRLSYLGAQGAFAFFLINLSDFKAQASLTVARDRVVGILLGLLVMWLVFDQLWSAPAGVEMKRTFVAALRSLAQLAREPVSKDVRKAIEYSYSLRENINAQFDKVRSLADGVLFEFGPSRGRDLELRGHILQWQPELRTLFVMRIASWKYRSQVPGFDFPDNIRTRQAAYDEQSAQVLEAMAARIEGNGHGAQSLLEGAQATLNQTIGEVQAAKARGLPANRAQSFITLLRSIDELTASLFTGITATFREGLGRGSAL